MHGSDPTDAPSASSLRGREDVCQSIKGHAFRQGRLARLLNLHIIDLRGRLLLVSNRALGAKGISSRLLEIGVNLPIRAAAPAMLFHVTL